MPGTARSKGCLTCIRRKVKCDETRPLCTRCLNARLSCAGYKRDRKWIDEGKKFSEPITKTPLATTRANIGVSRSISLYPLQDDICVEFLCNNFFNGHSEVPDFSFATWMRQSFAADESDLSHVSMKALAALYFAKMHGSQSALRITADSRYNKAVVGLRKMIQSPIHCYDNANLSAAMALTLYETIAYNSETAWVSHAGGTGRLLDIRGPVKVQSYPEHGQFLLARFVIIIEAMIQRKRTFLEHENWRTIPWVKHPETKTLRQYIIDILAFLPGLNEDISNIESVHEGNEKTEMTSAFRKKLFHLLKVLVVWRWQWEDENPVAVEERKVTSKHLSVDENGQPLFKSIFWYQNIEQAIEIALYNVAIAMIIHYNRLLGNSDPIKGVLESLGQMPTLKAKLTIPHAGMATLEPTMEICRSIEYMIHKDQSSIGSWSVMLPLRVVMISLVLNHQSPKLRAWIERISNDLATSSGFELIRRLSLLPPIGQSQNGLKEEDWLKDLAAKMPYFQRFLLSGDGNYWRQWLDSHNLTSEAVMAMISANSVVSV